MQNPFENNNELQDYDFIHKYHKGYILISKKNYDHRIIRIFYKLNADNKIIGSIPQKHITKIKDHINKNCKKIKIAKNIRNLNFILYENLNDKKNSWIHGGDMIYGWSNIYLNLYNIHNKSHLKKILSNQINNVWKKSITHIANNKINILTQLNEKHFTISSNKIDLPIFIDNMVAHGIHTFQDRYIKGNIIFSNKVLFPIIKNTHNLSKHIKNKHRRARQNFKESNFIKKIIKVNKTMQKHKINLGYRIIYKTLYLNHNLTIEKISNMKSTQILYEYETAMIKNGYKPSISLDSKNGIFDIKSEAILWNNLS